MYSLSELTVNRKCRREGRRSDVIFHGTRVISGVLDSEGAEIEVRKFGIARYFHVVVSFQRFAIFEPGERQRLVSCSDDAYRPGSLSGV